MRLGDGGLSIFQYSPAIAKPPETQALAKLATAESQRSGLLLRHILRFSGVKLIVLEMVTDDHVVMCVVTLGIF